MKRNLVIAMVLVFFVFVLLFGIAFLVVKKQTESRPSFRGPSGAPFVHGPFGPSPSH